jgi:hypothetical protein
MGEMKKVERRFGSATHVQRRAADGGARRGGSAGGAAVPMGAGGGRRCPVSCTGPKDRAERAGFSGSEGETKMGRATKWAKSQGGYTINSFF